MLCMHKVKVKYRKIFMARGLLGVGNAPPPKKHRKYLPPPEYNHK